MRHSHPSEHQIQAAFVQWVRMSYTQYPELRLSFAVPNAAKRSYALAKRMKDEGLTAGVPDWILPVARNGYCGFAIEFKRHNGELSEDQLNYILLLQKEGWKVIVSRNWESAKDVLISYLTPKEGDKHGPVWD